MGSFRHRYQLKPEDNGVTFICIMTTPALDEPRSCSLRVPNATIQPAVSKVEVGNSASFECHGDGVPYIASYRWVVTNADTGDILPSSRYTVSENGRSLEVAVMENLELRCIVSVQSRLYEASARVEVVNREEASLKPGTEARCPNERALETKYSICSVLGFRRAKTEYL